MDESEEVELGHQDAPVSLEEIYLDFESRSAGPGQIRRRVYRADNADLVALLNVESGLRAARFEFRNQLHLTGFSDQIKGLRLGLATVSADSADLLIEQARPNDGQLFAVVIEDLLKAIVRAEAGREWQAVASRLSRWQVFFQKSAEGLSRDQQLGLMAELETMVYIASNGADWVSLTDAWHGPASEVHDFSADHWALEVKATSVLGSGTAMISSERQLDPDEMSPLFLFFRGYDVRPHGHSPTLPSLVARVRSALMAFAPASNRFEDLLLEVGYLDLHARLYISHYELVREEIFYVNHDFPSIRVHGLPDGVSRTKYALNVDKCQAWRAPTSVLIAGFTEGEAE